VKSFARNFLSLLAADMVRRLLGFFSVAYLARVLGAEGFGAINIGYAVLSYGIILSSLGLATVGAREIARGASDEAVSDILSLRLVLALCVVAVISTVSFTFVRDATTAKIIAILSLSVFAYSLLIEWYFQGKEEMTIMAVGRVTSPALNLVMLIFLVESIDQILWVGVAAVCGDLLFAAVLLWRFKNQGGRLQFRIRTERWKSLLKSAMPIGVGLLLAQFTVYYPPIALGVLKTNSDVGIFSAANKIVFYLLMVDRVLAPLLLPALTRWQGISLEVLSRRSSDVLRLLMLIGLPVAVGGTILATPIVTAVFGVEYVAAADVFRVFVWYFILTIMSSVYTNSLLALGHSKAYGGAMLISAAASIVSVTFLTLWFGYLGTAFAIVFSEGITLAVLHAKLKSFGAVAVTPSVTKIFAACALMAVVVILLSSLHFAIVIFIGTLAYAVFVVMFKIVKREELSQLLQKA
jgi:O-antigen/teichoic acid export membrane protein